MGSILGLLAFFLAFTFGMAGSRFESRRQAVLDEANAIGTTYLRARLLPEPQRTESAKLLREYVDVRISGVQAKQGGHDHHASEELHDKLSAQAAEAADSRPTPITGLYIQSLNRMIDMHATRIQAGLRSRIPTIIWAGLFTLTILSMASVGYQAGLSATRRSLAMVRTRVWPLPGCWYSSRIWIDREKDWSPLASNRCLICGTTMNAERR